MTKYILNGIEMEDIEDVLNYLADNYDEEYFEEYLNESYPDYKICGMYYPASQILSKCDPIAYNCLLSNYVNSEREAWADGIRCLDNGDTGYICGYDIECIEEVYTCPVCGAEYDTEEEAEECCNEDEEE